MSSDLSTCLPVYLTTLAGNQMSFDVPWDSTVNTLKQLVSRQLGHDPSALVFAADTVKLADTEVLSDHMEFSGKPCSLCIRLGLIVAASTESTESIVEKIRMRYKLSESRWAGIRRVTATHEGDWAIIVDHCDDDNKDYYDYYLFHIPSYTELAQPLKHTHSKVRDNSNNGSYGGPVVYGSAL
eukprot:TRINITY_DN57291_c0_g1_i1.p1 TRINITY_DN57291_c0_g1~~TRINITY_DN57291_c0_g1_i1.p1  ORF type:complete len:183 (-),score=4.12 TRINITY_DN57291_c0_g1_i1:603-1151(-)